ncbi:MAG: DnaA regulatory inactivator Hda [Gammaproteobacteria bacterium]|nr:DnaA regulatory inactivator Hda [Gammaproteobacteria bacterium]
MPVRAELQDFIASNSDEIISAVKQTVASSQHEFLYLWSAERSGKTHLLSALCSLAEKSEQTVIYLPMQQANDLSPEIFEGLEAADIICIDDINCIAGIPDWEQAVFNLYNRLRDSNRKLVVTSHSSPASIAVSLPDLKSRLAWGISLGIASLDDADKKHILQIRAKNIGMELSDEAVSYLLNHHSRDLASLIQTLDKLEKASLIEKRKVTIPFLKDQLSQLPA